LSLNAFNYARPFINEQQERSAAGQRTTSRQTDGWVYVLSLASPASAVQVGSTSHSPSARAMGFVCTLMDRRLPVAGLAMWAAPTSDKFAHKEAAQRALAEFRLPGRRTLFQCSLNTAREAIRASCGAEPIKVTLDP
jgi:hypothetical protein